MARARRLLLTVAVVASAVLSACTVEETDRLHERASDRQAQQHVCTDDCDHSWDGTAFRAAGHWHHPGCGHVLLDDRWVRTDYGLAKSPEPGASSSDPLAKGYDSEHEQVFINGRWVDSDIELGHVCRGGCHHVWTGRGWVDLGEHVHGPACGHVIHDGRWVVGHGPRR